MSPETLILSYGYPILFLGIFFEGETFLLIGAYLAHRGYLSLVPVLAICFAATVIADQVYFWLGRTRGKRILARHPKWESRVGRLSRLLERFQLLLILSFRFLYGMRILAPLVIGASGYPPGTFLALNMIGALVWVLCIGLAGYAFGHAMEVVIEDIHRYDLQIVLAIFIVGTLIGLGYLIVRSIRNRSNQ